MAVHLLCSEGKELPGLTFCPHFANSSGCFSSSVSELLMCLLIKALGRWIKCDACRINRNRTRFAPDKYIWEIRNLISPMWYGVLYPRIIAERKMPLT